MVKVRKRSDRRRPDGQKRTHGRPVDGSVQLGMHLRELWRHKAGLVFVILLSLFAALWSVQKVSLLPPKISPRALEMGTASTHVLVDTPQSTAVNARAKAVALTGLTARANLLGNLIASPPVREFIARRAHISPDQIQAVGPITPDEPRALAAPGHEKRTSDILRSTDQYRLNVQVQPTAPIIDVYAQAPSKDAAAVLADASIAGLRDYLGTVASTQRIQPDTQVRLLQLGRARGGLINPGIRVQMALLSFFLVLGASSAAVLFVARVRRGWDIAAAAEDPDVAFDDGEYAVDDELERVPG